MIKSLLLPIGLASISETLKMVHEIPTSQPFNRPHRRRCAVSSPFDDARLSRIDAGIPPFASDGIRGTFCIPPDNVPRRFEGRSAAGAVRREFGRHTMPPAAPAMMSVHATTRSETIRYQRSGLKSAAQTNSSSDITASNRPALPIPTDQYSPARENRLGDLCR